MFVEDYDMALARSLVQGADIWLNTPVRPMEASGTSGMKAVLNGAMHCSVLDGWWAECFSPGLGGGSQDPGPNGWAISSA
ncbi:glycogen/starch/alpha-glucan phosphorylase, partial [Rhizobium oryzihabitans]|uniref:glycogen/starch/alpha-glucan phosphorylase n=1 Tax=Rhizobium oryzihabitans TaxID=2267833 RepID=UPI004036E138